MTSRCDYAPLLKLLNQSGLGHYAKCLYENQFDLDNLKDLTTNDLRTLHITNAKEVKTLLGVAASLEGDAGSAVVARACTPTYMEGNASGRGATFSGSINRSRLSPEQQQQHGHSRASGGAMVQLGEGDDDRHASGQIGLPDTATTSSATRSMQGPLFSATIPTAAECARQATVYLSHYHVDRKWPQAASKLAQALNLSTAAPTSTGEALYNLSLDATRPQHSTAVMPPCRHSHGYSARFCPVCAEHVNDGVGGTWQFQAQETVLIGEGLHDVVTVWKPFDGPESIRIEFTFKKRKPGVKVRGTFVDLDAMLWGDKPVRRVDGDAVPFPSLRPKDLVRAPPPSLSQQSDLAGGILTLQLDYLVASERTARLAILQEEQLGVADVLAMIHAIMLQFFAAQISRLEEEEAAARAAISTTDLEKELDKLWEQFEISMRDVALAQSRNLAKQIAAKQRAMLEDMEAIGRADIEAEEDAFRQNLMRLGKLLNNQIIALLDAQKHQAAMKKLRAGKKLNDVRCPVCRLTDCLFFRNKWQNHWKHQGGPLDLVPPAASGDTVSTLVAKACEHEYSEYMMNKRASVKAKRLKRALLQASSIRPSSPSPTRSAGGSLSRDVSPAADRGTANADVSLGVATACTPSQHVADASTGGKSRVSNAPSPAAEWGRAAPQSAVGSRPATAAAALRPPSPAMLPSGVANRSVTPFSAFRSSKRV